MPGIDLNLDLPELSDLLGTKALRVRRETVGTESTFSQPSRPRHRCRGVATILAMHTLSSLQEISQSGTRSRGGWMSVTSKDLKVRREPRAFGERQGRVAHKALQGMQVRVERLGQRDP